MARYRPHPLGRIVIHPDDVESEENRVGRRPLGPDYITNTCVPPRPEKNDGMTPEWHAYFKSHRPPRGKREVDEVGAITGVSPIELNLFYAPWAERRREKFVGANIKTRVAIQAKSKELHFLGYAVHACPDPWELEQEPYVSKLDTIALARASLGTKTDEEKEREREKRAGKMAGRLAAMRANLCEACKGVGGEIDEKGELVEPCKVCGGKGVKS